MALKGVGRARRWWSRLALTGLLLWALVPVGTAGADRGAAPALRIARVADVATSPELLARAQSAVTDLLRAMESADATQVTDVLSDELSVEFRLGNRHESIELESFPAYLAAAQRSGPWRIREAWLYPTGDATTVFLSFEVEVHDGTSTPSAEEHHLWMIEMGGERIARILLFANPCPCLHPHANAVTEQCDEHPSRVARAPDHAHAGVSTAGVRRYVLSAARTA